MTPFKELVSNDRSLVFEDLEMFAETHTFDGSSITCVLDSDEHDLYRADMGVESGAMRMFARAEDVSPRREAGDTVEVDGVLYSVISWKSDCGMAEITLVSRRSPY